MALIAMTRILITGAGAVLVKKFFNLKIPDLFLTYSLVLRIIAFAVGLHWADASHLIPMASNDDYISSLINILKQNAYDVLIPGTDIELPKISRFRENIEQTTGCKVIVSLPK